MSGFWNQHRKRKGALLLEVLLSVVILSAGLTVMIQAMTSGLRSQVYSTDYTTAVILLENEMFELLIKGAAAPDSFREGTFPAPHEKYRYRIDARDSTVPGREAMSEIAGRVSWASGKRNNEVTLETLLWTETP